MLAYYSDGETGLAIRQYETCCRILKEEFDVAPAEQTQELRNRVGRKFPRDVPSSHMPIAKLTSAGALTVEEFQLIENLTFRDNAANARAQELCKRAMQADKLDARPVGILAGLMYRQWQDNFDTNDSVLEEALKFAQLAVVLDKDNAYCHLVLAEILLCQRKYNQASKHYDHAWRLAPNPNEDDGGTGAFCSLLRQSAKSPHNLSRSSCNRSPL